MPEQTVSEQAATKGPPKRLTWRALPLWGALGGGVVGLLAEPLLAALDGREVVAAFMPYGLFFGAIYGGFCGLLGAAVMFLLAARTRLAIPLVAVLSGVTAAAPLAVGALHSQFDDSWGGGWGLTETMGCSVAFLGVFLLVLLRRKSLLALRARHARG